MKWTKFWLIKYPVQLFFIYIKDIPHKVGIQASQAYFLLWTVKFKQKLKIQVWFFSAKMRCSSCLLCCACWSEKTHIQLSFSKARKLIRYACLWISVNTMILFKFVLFYVKTVFISLWRVTWCQDTLPTVRVFVWESHFFNWTLPGAVSLPHPLFNPCGCLICVPSLAPHKE